MSSESTWGYSSNWGYAESSETSRYCEDDEGVLPPPTLNRFQFQAEVCDDLKNALLVTNKTTQIKMFQLNSDYDEYTLHSVCQLLLESGCLAFPYNKASDEDLSQYICVVKGVFKTKEIKDRLNLVFTEIKNFDDKSEASFQYQSRYVILAKILQAFFKAGYVMISPAETVQKYGTVAKFDESIEGNLRGFAIENMTLDSEGNVSICFETQSYKRQNQQQSTQTFKSSVCIFSGDKYQSMQPCSNLDANKLAKRMGYNDYLPETDKQMRDFYYYRFGVILPEKRVNLLLVTSSSGKTVVPEICLEDDLLSELPSRTRREAGTTVREIMSILESAAHIFSKVNEVRTVNRTTPSVFQTARTLTQQEEKNSSTAPIMRPEPEVRGVTKSSTDLKRKR